MATLVGLHHDPPPPPYAPPFLPTSCVSSGTSMSTPQAATSAAAATLSDAARPSSVDTPSSRSVGSTPSLAACSCARSCSACAGWERLSVSVSTDPSASDCLAIECRWPSPSDGDQCPISYQAVHRCSMRARSCTAIQPPGGVVTFHDAIADEKPPGTS